MLTVGVRAWPENREAAGFLVSVAFVCLASVRDLYLAGLFQRVSPPLVAITAFSLCSLVFLPIAFARQPGSLGALSTIGPWPHSRLRDARDRRRYESYDCEFVALARDLALPLVTADGGVLRAFPDLAIAPEAFAAK